jgi:hypothetical protein
MYLKQIFHVFPHKIVLGEKTLDKEISLMLKILDRYCVCQLGYRCHCKVYSASM